MPVKVVQLPFGPTQFYRSARSNKIRISVNPEKGIMVSFPWYMSVNKAINEVLTKKIWIEKQLKKIQENSRKIEPGLVIETKLFSVLFEKGEKDRLKADGKIAHLQLADFGSEKSKDFAKTALAHIYRYEAKQILPERLKKLAAEFGFKYNLVTIRNNKGNWGSCSSKNNISLNLQLMKLPDELIDFVLLHELVHTEIKNHGPEFWKKLDLVTGFRAKELTKEVKKHSTLVI